jgi:predicted P-loop ATPase
MIIILKERMLRIQVRNDEPEQQNEVRKQKEKEDAVDSDGCCWEMMNHSRSRWPTDSDTARRPPRAKAESLRT